MAVIIIPMCIVVAFLISSINGRNLTTRVPFGPHMCMELCRNTWDVCLFKVDNLTCYYAAQDRKKVKSISHIDREQLYQCSSLKTESTSSLVKQPNHHVCVFVEFSSNTNYTAILNQASSIGDLCAVQNIMYLGITDENKKQECGLAIVNAIIHGHASVFSFFANQGCNLSMVIANKFTPLHLAVHHNRLQMVRILKEVDEGFDIERKRGGFTPLLLAASEGHVQMFRLLTCMGANLTAVDDAGDTTLTLASGVCHFEMVRHILSLGVVDIDYRTPIRGTAVMIAALNSCIDVVKILVSQGVALTLQNSFNNNILHCAIHSENVSLIAYILDLHLFDMECRGHKGMTPLLHTAFTDSVEAFEFLKVKGSKIDASDIDGNNVLHLACKKDKLRLVKYIVENGYIGIETKGFKEGTPFLFAASCGRVNVLMYLQSKDCNIMARDSGGNTAMHIAVRYDTHARTMPYLLSRNIMSCEVTDNLGNTPILTAVMFSTLKTVVSMYKHGCKLTAINKYKINAIHLAATRNKYRTLRYVLNTGVLEIDSRSSESIKSLMMIARRGYTESLELLHQHGFNINITDDNGQNILHVACANGTLKMVKYILKRYYYFLERKDRMGRTPMLLAAQNAQAMVVKYLAKEGCNLSARTFNGDGLMHKACESRSLDFVKFVASLKGIIVQQKNHDGLTPANQAFRNGNTEIWRYLQQRENQ